MLSLFFFLINLKKKISVPKTYQIKIYYRMIYKDNFFLFSSFVLIFVSNVLIFISIMENLEINSLIMFLSYQLHSIVIIVALKK